MVLGCAALAASAWMAMAAGAGGAPAAPGAAPAAAAPSPDYWTLVAPTDAADLKVYRDKNPQLGPPKPGEDRVVFIGDSITENWQGTFNQNYPGKSNYIGRGRTSETTWHMLIRFTPDIVDIQAKVAVIMAGVNDVAGNAGAVTDENIHDNFISMFDIAKAHNIKVVLVSTLPATNFFWQPGIQGASQRVKTLVGWEKDYAASHGLYYVNAFDKFKDENDGMPRTYSSDTVHPNPEGYKILSAMVEEQIEKALKGEPPTQ
jgi:lysophospholipase L1-like esterase